MQVSDTGISFFSSDFNFDRENLSIVTQMGSIDAASVVSPTLSHLVAPIASNLTVLRAPNAALNKTFYLDNDGNLTVESYPLVASFYCQAHELDGIEDLGSLVHSLSQRPTHTIIRGVNPDLVGTQVHRTKQNFPEPVCGLPWVMIDLDGIDLPTGVSSCSLEAIRFAITKLPLEFQLATCFYQFSASSGIQNPDGSLRKQGLSVHLFYWLNCPVKGRELSSYLQKHCLDTGFYKIAPNKAGMPTMWYGIDPATIRNSVQPHYIIPPTLKSGVRCLLDENDRQGFLRGTSDEVVLPEIALDIIQQEFRQKASLMDAWKREHGYVRATQQYKTDFGIATVTSLVAPVVPGGMPKTGREFVDGKLQRNDDICILFFADERSPGSWRVMKQNPLFARRYGDEEAVLLKELSQGAYEHVRDVLKWFQDVPSRLLCLQDDGFLPPFDTFVRAQHSLILAPTGSGKTRRAIEWIKARPAGRLIIYATQTISLVKEMMGHCGQAGIATLYYGDFRGDLPSAGVVVTTNASLRKFVLAAGRAMRPFDLILDEIHIGLDEATGSNRKLLDFGRAISQAETVLYLTGTLTDLQRKMLATLVGQHMSGLDEAKFGCYEFAAIKAHPLHLYRLSVFRSEVVRLLQSLKEMHDAGQRMPRTVLLLPTSKMEIYRQLLHSLDLFDLAHIVSRPENTPEEIEEARTSAKPILVCSPMFATGLNLEHPPEIFWCSFDKTPVDASAIVQTINRANRRSDVACEVRIFVGGVDYEPIMFRPKEDEHAALAAYFSEGCEQFGLLASSQMLDRVYYNELRRQEKDTAKSFGSLISMDAFQNYKLVGEGELQEPDKDKKAAHIFKDAKSRAVEYYEGRVMACHADAFSEHPDIIFAQLDAVDRAERSNHLSAEPRPSRAFEYERNGRILRLIGSNTPAHAQPVNLHRLRVLFGERRPWMPDLSGRGMWGCDGQGKHAMAAERVDGVCYVLKLLQDLRDGNLSVVVFAKKLNQDKMLRPAALALCGSEAEYVALNKAFDKLGVLRQELRENNNMDKRMVVERYALKMAVDLLKSVGVTFPLVPNKNGRMAYDYSQAAVSDWDFAAMREKLKFMKTMLKSLSPIQEEPSWKLGPYGHEEPAPKAVGIERCGGCRLFYNGACAGGNVIDYRGIGLDNTGEFVMSSSDCSEYIALPAKLAEIRFGGSGVQHKKMEVCV